MSDERPTNGEALTAFGSLLQNCGCLIMLVVFVLVPLGFFLYACVLS